MHGELNKLAANIAIGLTLQVFIADGDCGMMLGQKVAIAYSQDYISRQIEYVVALLLLDLMEFQ